MRKRPILLVTGALTAGLAVFGTVCAQTPHGQPRPVSTGVQPPAVSVQPFRQPVSAGTQPQGGVAPAGGYLPAPTGFQPPALRQDPAPGQPAVRPRLTNPVMAGPDGVRPAGGLLPPPSMELESSPPAATPPAGSMPPPSVSIDPPPSAAPVIPPLPAGVTPVPAPAEPADKKPVLPVPPPAGAATPTPLPLLPVPGADTPASGPARTLPSASGTPTRINQNITIESVCPESVVYGQEFRYEIIIRNTGTTAVNGVRVEDEIPAGTRYLGSEPSAEQSAGRIAWSIGSVEAGAEKRITVRVQPTEEGEVRSRATVSVSTSVEARTRVTRPRVAAAVTGLELCKVGEESLFQIKVTNSGTGPAKRMIVQALLSDGLTHPHGAKLEMELTNLAPGETRTVPLRASASRAGVQWCQVTVAAEGCQDSTARSTTRVVEALLQVAQIGPAKCLVRAEPTYEITLSNPGTATTDPVTLYAVLPEGFDYVQSSDNATYSPANRSVVWKLSGLAAGSTKPVSLKLRAVAACDGVLRTIAQTTPEQPVVGAAAGGAPAKPAGRVLEAKTETAIASEGLAAVRFEVLDLDDPVEVGKEAVYEIRVMNQGTGACTNIQLVAATADGTEYKGSSGPTQVKAQGQHLVFEPIGTLAPKGEVVYRVKVRGMTAGDLRFRVQLTCDQVRTPIVKEESTRFYKQ